ncbi:MAG: flavodoxin family protein [Ruminococcaceae bacterium]|nr:flavodoxin family protein [Oscillospiraceae bacterium]
MKKTLIFNGSPRLRGDTVSIINTIAPKLEGEYKIVNCCNCKVAPCIDCRYCWENEGCAFIDGMQSIYNYIQDCDNILIASPVYFSELTGQLLSLGSRLQTYTCARYFRNEIPIEKTKKGAVVLVSGGDASNERAYDTGCVLLHTMNCEDIHPLIEFNNTNSIRATERANFDTELERIVNFFNVED